MCSRMNAYRFGHTLQRMQDFGFPPNLVPNLKTVIWADEVYPRFTLKRERKASRAAKPKSERKEIELGDYFCPICFQGFRSKDLLQDHMKTHLELEVQSSSCHMQATPAGVI